MYSVENIKRQYSYLTNESKGIVNDFLRYYPQYKVYEYSLLWITFDILKNNTKHNYYKRYRPLLYLPYIKDKRNYILHIGKFPLKLKQLFNNENIKIKQLIISSKLPQMNIANSIVFQRTQKYNFIDVNHCENNKIKGAFNNFLSYNNNDIDRFRIFLNRLFKHNRPMAIFSHEDKTKFSRVCVEIANEYNIPTIILQHGATPITDNNYIPFANESFAPLIASRFFAWGINTFNFLKQLNVDSDKIIITGNPFMNSIKSSKINKNNKILIIDQQFLSQDEERFIAYTKLKRILNTINLEFKIYMRNNYNYEFLQSLFSNKLLIKWRENGLKNVLSKFYITVGFYSTALIESFIMHNKVYSFDYLNRGDIMGFNELFPVFNENDNIRDIIYSDRNEHNKLKKHIECFNDNASKRIFEETMELL